MSKPFKKIKYTGVLGLDSQLDFGRHQGYTVAEVLKDRPEYILWLMTNTKIKFAESVTVQRSFEVSKILKIPDTGRIMTMSTLIWTNIGTTFRFDSCR